MLAARDGSAELEVDDFGTGMAVAKGDDRRSVRTDSNPRPVVLDAFEWQTAYRRHTHKMARTECLVTTPSMSAEESRIATGGYITSASAFTTISSN